MSKDELAKIFNAVMKEMRDDGVADRIADTARAAIKSGKPLETIVTIQVATTIEYSNELLFRVLAKALCKS